MHAVLRTAAFTAALVTVLAVALVPATANAEDPGHDLDRARAGLAIVEARLADSDAHLATLDERILELESELEKITAERTDAERRLKDAIAGRAQAEARHAEALAQPDPVELPAAEARASKSRGTAMRSAVAAAGPGKASAGLAGVLDAAQKPGSTEERADADRAGADLEHLERVLEELQAETARAVEAKRALVEESTAAVAQLTSRALDLEIALGVALAERDMVAPIRAAMEARVEEARAAMGGMRDQAGAPGTGPYVWPTAGTPTSGFGPRIHPVYGAGRLHSGVDIPGPVGQPIVAADDGTVVEARAMTGYGLTVVLEHADGTRTLYAHMSELAVTQGQAVAQTDRIGSLGNTGVSTGPHLHFEVHVDGQPVNPMQWFE